MKRSRWIWLVLTLVRVSFFSGYTSFGGPLSDEQIESCYALTANGKPKPGPELLARLRTFMKEETGDGFVMSGIGKKAARGFSREDWAP